MLESDRVDGKISIDPSVPRTFQNNLELLFDINNGTVSNFIYLITTGQLLTDH